MLLTLFRSNYQLDFRPERLSLAKVGLRAERQTPHHLLLITELALRACNNTIDFMGLARIGRCPGSDSAVAVRCCGPLLGMRGTRFHEVELDGNIGGGLAGGSVQDMACDEGSFRHGRWMFVKRLDGCTVIENRERVFKLTVTSDRDTFSGTGSEGGREDTTLLSTCLAPKASVSELAVA